MTNNQQITNFTCLLCSSFATVLPKLLEQKLINKGKFNVGFIKNASDLYIKEEESNPWWISDDQKALESIGYICEEIDLKKYNKTTLKEKLSTKDAVFVCGGNTFYLLKCMVESGFTEIINDLIANGLKYISTSAGTCVTGPNIEYAKFVDDPKVVTLPNYNGLNLHNFYIDVHFGSKGWEEEIFANDTLKKQSEFLRKNKLSPYITLTDEQALCLGLNDVKIIW